MAAPLYIVGTGVVSSVGFSAPASCAAVRAALDAFTLTGFRDRVQGPTIWSQVPIKPDPMDSDPFSRLTALGSAALYECAAAAGAGSQRCAVILNVREPYRQATRNAWRAQDLLREIEGASGLGANAHSSTLEGGHAGALAALAQARTLLSQGRVDLCFVGGVDSYLNVHDLELLGKMYRLKSEHVVQGFIPSEGAAFVALSLKRGPRAKAQILGIGTAQETAEGKLLSPDAVPQGRGLTKAILAACSDASLHESAVEFRLSDMNGEAFRVRENMFAITRAYRTRRELFPHFYPAASLGDVGAASSPFLLVLAATAFERDYAPGRVAICEAASDGGLRACGVLKAVG